MTQRPTPLTYPQKLALTEIVRIGTNHGLSLDDIAQAYPPVGDASAVTNAKTAKNGFLTMLLGLLGGALIASGFFIYATMIWDDLGSFGRVALSLGTGLLCFFLGGILQRKDETGKAAPFLWSMAFLLIPTGLFVFLKEYIGGDDPIMGGVIVFGICTAMFFALYYSHRTKTLFSYTLFFAIALLGTTYEKLGLNIPGMWLFTGVSFLLAGYHAYRSGARWQADRMLAIGAATTSGSLYYFVGNTHYEIVMSAVLIGCIIAAYQLQCRHFLITATAAFVIVAAKHFGFSAGYREDDILRLTAAVTGISMMLTGHWVVTHTLSSKAPGLWYFFGSALFFSAAMGILYATPFDALFVLFPAAILYLSLILRSRALMFSSILAILSFISYYSAKYFANTIGWPITLMMMGFLLIGGCALAMRLNKRLKEPA